MQEHVYQIIIKCDDGLEFRTFYDAPEGFEEILKDFFFDQYQHVQSNPGKYIILDITKQFGKLISEKNKYQTFHLAMRGVDYSECYS